ncbi:MAG: hypothetical protein EOO22_13960 [Comamonadaceae bacterium]|nr:MAG: hypothetical protein EOO22_13960 [Comamonadaceae bacterium]
MFTLLICISAKQLAYCEMGRAVHVLDRCLHHHELGAGPGSGELFHEPVQLELGGEHAGDVPDVGLHHPLPDHMIQRPRQLVEAPGGDLLAHFLQLGGIDGHASFRR